MMSDDDLDSLPGEEALRRAAIAFFRVAHAASDSEVRALIAEIDKLEFDSLGSPPPALRE